MLKGAIFDIDGTLLDSLGLRAQAWSRAFAEHGWQVPAPEIRHRIGSGGEASLSALLDEGMWLRGGAAIQAASDRIFHADGIDRLQPLPQVHALLAALHGRHVRTALASVSMGSDPERHRALLPGAELVDASAAPDIFQAAMDSLMPLDREHALAFGCTPWQIGSATRLGLRIVGLRCGGFADAELEEAGAIRIYDDPADLLARLDEILLLV